MTTRTNRSPVDILLVEESSTDVWNIWFRNFDFRRARTVAA